MKTRWRLFLLVVGLSSAIDSTFAACPVHTGDPQKPAPDESRPRFDWERNLTGDWFGLRNSLYDYGIEINGSYVNEPAGNPAGGLRHDFTYLHNFDISLLLHFDKLVGIQNTTLLVTSSMRAGRGLTQEAIGNAISVQQIFGGGQTERLVQVRMEHHLFEERFSLSYGRITATSDFLTSPFYCAFVNNGICGQPPAPFFNMTDGITAYPAATWGAVAEVKMPKEIYVKAGVYDGDPNNGYDLHGMNFGFGSNGVLLMGEIGWKPQQGLLSMPGRFSLGAYYHTGRFQDVAEDPLKGNRFLSGLPGREHRGQHGFYVLIEQMLHENPDRPKTGLNGFLTVVISPDEDKSTMPYFVNAGLVYEGLVPGRPKDKTALGMYSAWFSSTLRGAQRAAGLPRQTNETDIELNHQVQITPWLYLRPNIQYVINPNGMAQIRDAFVIGFETGVTF
jgi:porin